MIHEELTRVASSSEPVVKRCPRCGRRTLPVVRSEVKFGVRYVAELACTCDEKKK